MRLGAKSRQTRKTVLYLAVAIVANSFGNLLLAIGMERMPAYGHVALSQYLLGLLTDPYLLPGATLSAIYALAQLSLFSWADLSFVVPCTALSYVISTVLAQFILGEAVDLPRWLGVLLIAFGVGLVANTPVATTAHGARGAHQ